LGWLKFFLALLLIIPAVHGQFVGNLEAPSTEVGLDYALIGNITHDMEASYTVIDAEVENNGFETILIKLPDNWEADLRDYSAKGEPILVNKVEIHRKFGFEGDRYSFIRNNFVYQQRAGFAVSKGDPLTIQTADGEAVGWYIRPNERLLFHIRLKPGHEEAVFDPFALERNRSDVKVIEWTQRFFIVPEKAANGDLLRGWMRIPYIVKGATMVESFPGVFANLSAFTGGYYFNRLELEAPTPTPSPAKEAVELDTPAWDEWFTESKLFKLNPEGLASLKTEPLPIPEVEKPVKEEILEETEEGIFIPVWLIDYGIEALRYEYKWKLGRVFKGVDVDLYTKKPSTLTERYGSAIPPTPPPEETVTTPKLDLTTVPEWYAWF
jgi:hypothetical protein